MQENPQITVGELMTLLNRAESTINDSIAKLKAAGVIRRVGPDKGGHWEVSDDG